MQEEKCEGRCEHEGCCEDCQSSCMDCPMKKEFKLAMIEKKEKMLQAKLEFLGKIKELIKKMPENKK